jgi:cytochrome c-type biogenesis protein CcmF
MIDLGHFALIGSWLLAIYGTVVGVLGGLKADERFYRSARNATLLCSFFGVLSLVALIGAFLTHNYRYAYVWRTSNNDMDPIYLISAVWGGMDGSMLLWGVLNSIYCALAIVLVKDASPRFRHWLIPPLASTSAFFLTVVVLLTNPFRLVPDGVVLKDGNGLNPLLQNPSMMIHPPTLYLGFTGFVVPFGFAIAGLISGETRWSSYIRRWTLIAWAFLSTGIILGGNWAYIELGWGGFWAWDPVENASFLPWLTATAFLHSVMVEERRGMLKRWNLTLAILSYLLAVFGTFLTRSGIVQSVHAFAETDFGWVFLVYLGLVAALSIALIVYRSPELRSKNSIRSYLSREAIFLFNNLILLGICFSTFWGVMFPVLSEAFVGEKSVVGPPFYNGVNGPLFLMLLFFMGLGPLVSWKQMELKRLFQIIRIPLGVAAFVAVVSLILEPGEYQAALAFSLCSLIAVSVLNEIRRAMKSGAGVVRSKSRRVGGLVVHLGVAVMGVGIAASSLFKLERDFVVNPGQQVEIGRYALRLVELREQPGKNYSAIVSQVDVSDRSSGEFISSMFPERRFYPRSQEATTEVEIRTTMREDLYVALAGLGEKGEAVFKVFVNPLQFWVWVGALVMLVGTVSVIMPAAGGRSDNV